MIPRRWKIWNPIRTSPQAIGVAPGGLRKALAGRAGAAHHRVMPDLAKPKWDVEGRCWPRREWSRFARAGGLEWHVQSGGSGPVCLLLHGTGAATHSWRRLAPLLADLPIECRVDFDRVEAECLEGIDLILHQRDQWGYDNCRSRTAEGWHLIAKRLAAAGWHQDECIISSDDMVNDFSLLATKAVIAEHFLQNVNRLTLYRSVEKVGHGQCIGQINRPDVREFRQRRFQTSLASGDKSGCCSANSDSYQTV